MKTTIIILAAGNSSRLGQPKQMLKMGEMSLLNHTIEAAIASKADHVLVVLGHDAELIKASIEREVPSEINPDWLKGMGNSLKFGLRQAHRKFGPLDAVIVSVCDQPYLSSNIFDGLITHALSGESAIVASEYDNEVTGVPVLFKNSMFEHLNQTTDQAGAKVLLKAFPNKVTCVTFDKGLIDIDRKEDLQFLK